MNFEERLGNTLRFDALDSAEKLTGKYYQTDEKTANIGLFLHILKNEDLRKRLIQNCDTYFGQSLKDYIQTIKTLNFVQIYEEEFLCESTEKTENHYCFINWDLGVLLNFESYKKNVVNGGDYYYNWQPNDFKNYPHECISSGSFCKSTDKYINVGYRDCREGVKYYLTLMMNYGQFVKPWVETPFYWITNRQDFKNQDKQDKQDIRFSHLKTVTEKRLNQFPERFLKEIMIERYK